MVDTVIINLDDFYESKDFNKTFQLVDNDGNPVDITGYSFTFKAKLPEATNNLVEKTMTITDAANGKFQLALDPSDTGSFEVGRVYQYQVQGITSGGEDYVFVTGEFVVKDAY